MCRWGGLGGDVGGGECYEGIVGGEVVFLNIERCVLFWSWKSVVEVRRVKKIEEI